MLCLTCTMISSVDLAHYGVSRANDWVSVDCGTIATCTAIQRNNQLEEVILEKCIEHVNCKKKQ